MTDKDRPILDPAVKAVAEAWPEPVRERLLELRELILETADANPDIGEIEETLKWGQASYLPKRPRTGTTLRIDALKSDDAAYAMYFHCQSSLMETFKTHYPDTFAYEGSRAIVFHGDDPVDREALAHCIALALTYHRKRR